LVKTEKAYFAGGCFWGLEFTFQKIIGVISTDVGYGNSDTNDPTYINVCTGETGAAEVVEVEFDPSCVHYEELLDIFFENHDPTTLNQQGLDRGTQYRSGVFTISDHQKILAEKAILKHQNHWENPIVTEVVSFENFFKAEEYHQDYIRKNGPGSCRL